MIAYKVKDLKVVEVECPNGMKYPELDSDGDKIFENSHFSTKEEAYAKAIEDCNTGISWAAREIKSLWRKIRERQDKMTEYAVAKNALLQKQEGQA